MRFTEVRKDQMVGSQDNVTSVPIQKTQRRSMGRLPYKNLQYGQEDMDTDGLAFHC